MEPLKSEIAQDIKYSVIITGNTLLGFSQERAAQGFAKLFKLSEKKSSSYICERRVLKKDLRVNKAHEYKNKLESIGLDVELVAKQNHHSSRIDNLSLVPVSDESSGEVQQSAADSEVTCSKCQQTQSSGKFCTSCGASFADLGLTSKQDIITVVQPEEDKTQSDAQTKFKEDRDFKPAMLISCSIAAVLGSLIWLAVLMFFDYELGIVAWIIGIMVGYASVLTGSRGETVGIICAIFTTIAIFGGKYLAFESIQVVATNINEIADGEKNHLREIYIEEKQIAQEYIMLAPTENSLKRFMIKHQFSFANSIKNVTQQELQDFEIYSKPRLTRIATTNPNFEQWLNNTVSDIQGISSFDLITQNFDFYDALFLFLGVFTAFRIAKAGPN